MRGDGKRDVASVTPNIHLMTTEERLRYAISRYKEHDRRRGEELVRLREENQRLREEAQAARDETSELIDAYAAAPPLVADPGHKAYAFALLRKLAKAKAQAQEAAGALNQAKMLKESNHTLREENARLRERIAALGG